MPQTERAMKSKLLFEEHAIALLLLVMLLIMGANVVTRKLPLNISISFAEELVVYLFVCASMLGASAAAARGANMGLNALVDLMPGNLKVVFAIVSAIASILLFGFLFYQGVVNMQTVIRYGQKTPILRIPQWIFTIFYCIGPALYIYRVIQATARFIKQTRGK
jgi:TRAP-type C4-dicarboxylate transport system permease small subunit